MDLRRLSLRKEDLSHRHLKSGTKFQRIRKEKSKIHLKSYSQRELVEVPQGMVPQILSEMPSRTEVKFVKQMKESLLGLDQFQGQTSSQLIQSLHLC